MHTLLDFVEKGGYPSLSKFPCSSEPAETLHDIRG